MRRALVSDIHGNIESFQRVLEDIASQGVTEILCLGDVVGYGPYPMECLDIAMKFPLNLMGNHEEAVLFGAVGFNPKAKAAIDWTRELLNSDETPVDLKRARWNFIGDLKLREDLVEGGRSVALVHGTPREPTREYLFQTDILDQEKMDDIFSMFEQVCFGGHTHNPGVFTQDYHFYSPRDMRGPFRFPQQKVFVNIGSVGQPRDGDPRACYVIFDEREAEFRRVEYDVEKTVQAVLDNERLPDYLGQRLRGGR